jgi:hypothetical protein
MKDAVHHLKYIQKKVIQSTRRAANGGQPNGEQRSVNNNTVSFSEGEVERRNIKLPSRIRI